MDSLLFRLSNNRTRSSFMMCQSLPCAKGAAAAKPRRKDCCSMRSNFSFLQPRLSVPKTIRSTFYHALHSLSLAPFWGAAQVII